jgi:hypothetical protein
VTGWLPGELVMSLTDADPRNGRVLQRPQGTLRCSGAERDFHYGDPAGPAPTIVSG